MGRRCLAPGCLNRKGIKNSSFFYTLPRDQKLIKKWLAYLRIDRVPPHLPSKNHFVCCKHFEPDCFDRDFRAELLGEKRRPPLKKGSVPTLFEYNNFQCANTKKRLCSEERRRKKDREEMLKDMLGPYHDMKLIPPDLITELKDDEHLGEFSIQSLLPNFALTLETEELTDHANAKKLTEDSANLIHEEANINGRVSHLICTVDRNQTSFDDSINSSRDGPYINSVVNHRNYTDNEKPSISNGVNRLSNTNDKSRTAATCNRNNPKVSNGENYQIRTNNTSNNAKSSPIITRGVNYRMKNKRIKCGLFTDSACQTVKNPTTEISCQIKPCLVSVETQWDEKDFLPDPELVERDHAYCKKMCDEVDSIEVHRENTWSKRKRRKKKQEARERRFVRPRTF